MLSQLQQLMVMMLLREMGYAINAQAAGRSGRGGVVVLVGRAILMKPFLFEGGRAVYRRGGGG